jgi:hypothetical protein
MKKKPQSKNSTQKPINTESLVKFNLIAGVAHLVQGVVMLVLSNRATLPITTSYLTADTTNAQAEGVQLLSATRHLFDLPLVYLPVGFVFMSALAHFIVATVYKTRYVKDLKRGINKARWIEYAVSASTMIVAVSMLSGVYDLGSLIALFALTAGMNLMGLVMELWNEKTSKTNWLSYWIGCGLGIVPWVVIALYFWSAETYGAGGIPTFVYWIYVSIFVAFNSFAINMWLQYRAKGKWSNYLYGEKMYIVLSLVAKAGLAWQVWAGTLRP